jgi:hypothetical protein
MARVKGKTERKTGLSQQFKICPICGSSAHRSAVICPTCGTSLADVPVSDEDTRPIRPVNPRYDRRFGETDLFESELRRPRGGYLFTALLALVAVACIVALTVAGVRFLDSRSEGASAPPAFTTTTALPEAALTVSLATNTPRPTMIMSTVTPAPPTSLPTETPGPCTRQIQPGDDLISLAWACGHRDLAVIPLILEMNNLSAPEEIRAGDTITIPWPTGTPDPNAAPPPSEGADVGSSDTVVAAEGVAVAAVGLDVSTGTPAPNEPTLRPTETLLPGVMWHRVGTGDTMASIVYQYNTEAETLEKLNPQIDFLQCDFGERTGGPTCIVLLVEGQDIRVPAPSPTPTLSPTLSGSETPTPTSTPTFNAPSALSPADRTLFGADELITLRWVATGTLGVREVYRVRVTDTTLGVDYSADTAELSFILPNDWQSADGQRHEYLWTVSVVSLDAPDNPIFVTEPRSFTWQGRN